jgi:hypothetical protein
MLQNKMPHGFDTARNHKNILKKMNVNKECGKAAEIHDSKRATNWWICSSNGQDGSRQGSSMRKDKIRRSSRDFKESSVKIIFD